EKSEYSIFQSVLIRGMNFLTTLFLPLSLLIGLFRELPQLGLTKLGWIDLAARSFSWHLGSVLGNLSLTVTIFLLLKLWQRLKSFGKKTLRPL
ncbi:hypothetical protein GWO43_04355, partial [candidate division KSB1 bacterium]|nr:hypothetical protein [candidate division KSB1 bacterium]NIR70946.1 hypothetical protein [candidate division KSB1 bacterium]NIS23249.1 hypothetical protein [candidate division KSB1 bacterium]NIT70131.1 hypothetical protein [candidate division KSB1 bacterium]NIU23785.1 hypothetical protein [candidate division KSB1 bacterium]